jgi:hypothetical protein
LPNADVAAASTIHPCKIVKLLLLLLLFAALSHTSINQLVV